MRRSEHEKLLVYNRSLELAKKLDAVARALPSEELRDQLRRASISIVLNIAEGAGEFSPAEKSRFYRIARRSAAECLAIIDLTQLLFSPAPSIGGSKADLLDVSAMLTAMVKVRRS